MMGRTPLKLLLFAACVLLGMTAGMLHAAAPGKRPRPPATDCLANVRRCMETPLAGRDPKEPHQSICATCLRRCEGQRKWIEVLDNGTDCRWWKFE